MKVLLLVALVASAGPGPFFVDEALRTGLKDILVCGGEHRKNYIVETVGTGVAFLDFDNDGLLDIFAVTALKLDGFPPGKEPVNRLYRNMGDRTFEEVGKKAGVAKAGWGQGVCAGDIDNDGYVDLYIAYWGSDVCIEIAAVERLRMRRRRTSGRTGARAAHLSIKIATVQRQLELRADDN